jgi:hypothetical protein
MSRLKQFTSRLCIVGALSISLMAASPLAADAGAVRLGANQRDMSSGSVMTPDKVYRGAATLAPAAASECRYKYFCVWEGRNFSGAFHPMLHCQFYSTPYVIGSWINNQTPGTRARFHDNRKYPVYTTPGAYSKDGDSFAIGLNTWFIKPC